VLEELCVVGTLEELCTVGIVELLELTIGATLLEDAVTALLVPLLALLVPLPALLAGVLAEQLETETLEFEDALRPESLELATFEFEEMLEPESLEPDVFDVGIAWFSLSLLAGFSVAPVSVPVCESLEVIPSPAL
jgi:hypothetical protein